MSSAKQFQKHVGGYGSYSWVVLFVEAPIDAVTDAYASSVGRPAVKNIKIEATGKHQLSPEGCIVQVSDSDWLIVFHSIGHWTEFPGPPLAKQLNARVLKFSGEDTSGSVDCVLHTPDGSTSRYQISSNSESDEELYDEMSEYAEESGIEFNRPGAATVVESYGALFETLGVCPLVVSLGEDGTALVLKKEIKRIVRVDSVGQQAGQP